MPAVARATIVTCLALLMVMVAACAPRSAPPRTTADPLDALTEGFDATVRADVDRLRAATRAFHDLSAAHAAGYPTATPRCIADSTMGGMGSHYFDRAAYDDTLRIEHPEMLLYAPAEGGARKLVAVEYVVPFRLRPAEGTPPRLFGQEFRRHEEFKYWYLHVWAWERNPAGLFADWNPTVKCP